MKHIVRWFGAAWAAYGAFYVGYILWELSRIPTPTGDQLNDAVLGVVGCFIFCLIPGALLFDRYNKTKR